MKNKKITLAEQDGIDFFEETLSDLLDNVFDMSLSDVLVTDLSSILDFSIFQEDLDKHLDSIKEHYAIDLRESKNYNILSLCRLIESKKIIKIH